MTLYDVLLYIFVGLYGLVIGSFLNVCIFRIPKGEGIARTRSHCMNCGYELKWYDLIPVFSYIGLRGRCRKCKEKISIQYPLVESLNALLYVLIFLADGFSLLSVVYCLMASALIVLSVIDERTRTIPYSINIFLMFLGVVRVLLDYRQWYIYIIGAVVMGVFIFILWYAGGMGGGDLLLMIAAGLLLGYKGVILALFAGCIVGSVIHLIRMKFFGAERKLSFGPYLAIGIILSMFFAQAFLEWYCGGIFA